MYGGSVRIFAEKSLETVLVEASLAVTAQRGVRVLSDYLPPRISRKDEYERILELERKLARRPEFAAIARYTHWLAKTWDEYEQHLREERHSWER
jgi:uncharacterized protein YeaO (DUF488 family)